MKERKFFFVICLFLSNQKIRLVDCELEEGRTRRGEEIGGTEGGRSSVQSYALRNINIATTLSNDQEPML